MKESSQVEYTACDSIYVSSAPDTIVLYCLEKQNQVVKN